MFEVLFFSLIVVAGTAGELCVSRAMKQLGEVHDFRPTALIKVFLRALRVKWLWIGVALMTVGFFSLLAILSFENVSFVVPVTALGYKPAPSAAGFFSGNG